MKPLDTTKTGFGYRFANDEETRRAARTGAMKGNRSRTIARTGNRADSLLKRFD